MLAEGSHQVVPSWNHISQFLMPLAPYDRVHAAVSNMATPSTTSERKPRTKELITPIVLKKLTVEDIFKAGDTTAPSNYRPISLLSIFKVYMTRKFLLAYLKELLK